ncbi:peroxidase 6, partial [Carica papaya]|uniref:peroxidase 6 n=1 Tax=Carica papaya TaxID=3649 RepID=UPI000B8C8F59
SVNSKLTVDYYKKSCPRFEEIVRQVVTDKQMQAPTTAAGVVRLFFHDCMVESCDASILIASTHNRKAERDHDINLSLPGDAFDVITRIKTALELECPGIVSCSDIIAIATRNLVVMVGGPHYEVRFGRKDGTVSDTSRVDASLAKTTTPIDQIITMFGEKGLSVQELVALLGAHTIGFTHCKEFAKRIYNFSPTSQNDPQMDPEYAEALRKLCMNHTMVPQMSAFNDVFTPGKFDNMYYKNLRRRMALLQSDQAVATDKRTRPFVDLYAANQTAFFEAFGRAMQKVSILGVKTGRKGEVRRRCDQFNNFHP